MATCAACGRWAGRPGEPCPHCGVSPGRKGSGPPKAGDPLSFMDEFLDDEEAPAVAGSADGAQRTPTPAEFERWYAALDESPVFAGTGDERRPPSPAPHARVTDLIAGPRAAPTSPPAPMSPLPGDSCPDLVYDEDAVPVASPLPEPVPEEPTGAVGAPVLEPITAAWEEPFELPQQPAASPPVVKPLDVPTLTPIVEPKPVPTVAPLRSSARSAAAGPSRRASAPVVQPMNAPVVQPMAAPVVQPLSPPGEHTRPDDRSVEIDVRTELVSYPGAEEPLVSLLVTLTPDGAPLVDASKEPVAHVILALDVSASMNRTDKYPLLTEALSGMLYDLRRPGAPDVLLSVVLYAYGAETVFRDRLASTLEPRDVLRQIDRSSFRFGRYTDMVGALQRAGRIAYDQTRSHKSMPVRICLLTDGRPQDVEGTRKVMEQLRKMPVDVDALAFGKDADVAVLQDLVSGGRGGTVKQVRSDSIGEAFGRIAETASRVITNRALFDFGLRPGVVGGSAFRHRPGRHSYGDNAFAGGREFHADLGTLESGRRYSLLFQVRLPEATNGETEIGTISLRLPGHGGARVFESLIAVPRHAGELAQEPDRDVQAAHDVLGALGASDPQEQLRALRVRKKIYEQERRDPRILAAVDRAIEELEQNGTLDRLSAEEQAAILSHTRTCAGVGAR